MKRRNFLRLLGSGSAAASGLPLAASNPGRGAVRAEPARTPLEIGQEKQLFLDDHVVETLEPRVFKLLNQPVRHPENPVIPLGTDWEQKGGLSHGGDAATVLYDPELNLYRFYGWMIPWPARENRFENSFSTPSRRTVSTGGSRPWARNAIWGTIPTSFACPSWVTRPPEMSACSWIRWPERRRSATRSCSSESKTGSGASIRVTPRTASTSGPIRSPGPPSHSTAIPTTTRSGTRGPMNTSSTTGPTRDWIVGFSRSPSILRAPGRGRRHGRPAKTSWTGTGPATSGTRKSGTSVFTPTRRTASGTGTSTPWRCSHMPAGQSVLRRCTTT